LINEQKEIIIVPISEIIFIEKEGNYAVIHTEKELFKTVSTLSVLEKYLDDRFLRVHKCYIANKNSIKKLIRLENRSYKIEFRNTIKYAFLSRYKYNEIKGKFGGVVSF
jgi:two-component system LytT family response regulator